MFFCDYVTLFIYLFIVKNKNWLTVLGNQIVYCKASLVNEVYEYVGKVLNYF